MFHKRRRAYTMAARKSARSKKQEPDTVTDPMLLGNAAPSPVAEALKTLTGMVKRYDALCTKADKQAEQLLVTTDMAARILEKEIPEYMVEIEVRNLTLRDGRPVSCLVKSYGSIKVDDRPKAHAWLVKHGHGHLIKNTVTATFGVGEAKAAASLEKVVEKKGYGVKRVEAVNANTFSAWVREMAEGGKRIPQKLFNLYQRDEVTIGKTTKRK